MPLLAHAGDPIEREHAELDGEKVTLADDNTYWVQNGYYVPYYPVSEAELGKPEQLKLLDDMATDLAKRFFRSAEVGINVRFSWENIEKLKVDYRHTQDPSEKRALGALLVGASIARMERLAHALIAQKSGGDISQYPISAECEKPLKEQFSDHMMFLMGHEEGFPKMLSNVRLRGGEEDINGLLEEMAGEVFHPTDPRMMPRLNENRAIKIGRAMGGMDEVTKNIFKIFRTNWPHQDSKMLAVTMARELKPTIEELTMQCQRRVGTRTSDAENYAVVYAGQNACLHKLRKQLDDFRIQCDEIKGEALDALINCETDSGFSGKSCTAQKAKDAEHMRQLMKSLDLVEEGAEMLMDMSEMRMSHREGEKKVTSIDNFAQKIKGWQEDVLRAKGRGI